LQGLQEVFLDKEDSPMERNCPRATKLTWEGVGSKVEWLWYEVDQCIVEGGCPQDGCSVQVQEVRVSSLRLMNAQCSHHLARSWMCSWVAQEVGTKKNSKID